MKVTAKELVIGAALVAGGIALMSNPRPMGSILVYGDSHIVNMASRLKAGLEARGAQVFVDGVVGRSLQTVLDQASIPNDVAGGWSTIVVEFGTNDANNGVTCAKLESQLAQLAAQGNGARVIFIGPPQIARADLGPKVAAYDACLRDLAPRYGIRYISSADLAASGWSADQVHFTGSAYNSWADGLISRI